ncbi:MAG: efflux RND transporter periplasmic adaptor subunit [Prevotella sp.]|jgi:membrane fusion protein (multidrug efflux system)|nr:efflux RND transporter periplasmic adaptor subunit [Prevotella sp.]MCI2087482.1 efflux RND transporter periplasmic adaptor subunit [Prevotella sp.]MCI2124966.1 efflux RND transporter periplasmic adaptor subunit [Prevotella sp.]
MKMKDCLFVVVLAATLVACGGKKKGLQFGNNEYPVCTIEASSASLQTTYPATIKGIKDVEIRPMASGFITGVFVHEGQAVRAGQVLFTIDSQTYRAAVLQARAAVGTAIAQRNTTRLTYQNSRKLFAKNIIGKYELQTAYDSYRSAGAQVAQARAAVIAAQQNLSYCTVTAPVPGVIGSLPYKIGTLVSPSMQTPFTTVSDVRTVEVFFSISESEIMRLSQSSGSLQSALASFPAVKLLLADGSTYNQPGRVVKMSGVIDPTTGAVSLIAHFSNPQGLLRSGGSGQIVIPSDDSRAIVIPQEACTQVQDKIFVYVVGHDNKVKYTEIMVNPQNDGLHYIVTGGLHVGDRIVTKGISSLTDGMKIVPITEEQYQENLDKAAKLGSKQNSAKGFINAMKGN